MMMMALKTTVSSSSASACCCWWSGQIRPALQHHMSSYCIASSSGAGAGAGAGACGGGGVLPLRSSSRACFRTAVVGFAGPQRSVDRRRRGFGELRELRTESVVVSEGGGGAVEQRRAVRAFAAVTSVKMGQEVVEEKMDPVQKKLMFADECILVDENDNVLGHDSKYNCHLMEKIEKNKSLHRAFSVFLFNSKNELLLQKRSGTKVTFPLVWTNTCCSHPLFREDELIVEDNLGVRNAAQRKLFDELGIEASDAPVADFTCLGRMLYKAPSDGKWGEHEVDYLVFMKRDVALKPNADEVADVMYVTKEKLKELVTKAKKGEDGVKLSPWFQLVVENFLYDWWKRVEEGTLKDVVDMKTIHKLV